MCYLSDVFGLVFSSFSSNGVRVEKLYIDPCFTGFSFLQHTVPAINIIIFAMHGLTVINNIIVVGRTRRAGGVVS